jgi:hypothetical protein
MSNSMKKTSSLKSISFSNCQEFSRIFFFEPEVSLPHLQDPTTCPCPKLHQSIPLPTFRVS